MTSKPQSRKSQHVAQRVAALALSPDALSAPINEASVKQAMAHPYPETLTFIGQERASKALDFALGMTMPGYNAYVMGEAALGRFSLVQSKLNEHAKAKQTPQEWLYVNNFADHREPVAVCLPAGLGKAFAKDMNALIDEVLDTFPAGFDNPGYQRKKRAIDRDFNDKYDDALGDVEEAALAKGIALFEEKGVLSFAPVIDGKQLSDAEFAGLDDAKRQFFYDAIGDLEDALNEALIELPKWKRDTNEQLRQLKKATATQAIKPLLKQLEHDYAQQLGILKYLKTLHTELVDAILDWLDEDDSDEGQKGEEVDKNATFTEYFMPNLLVSYEQNVPAPVIYEPNPTLGNVFGKIEFTAQQGSLMSSYRSIVPGALHRANGGYLILDAHKLIQQAELWDSLKRALKVGQIKQHLAFQDTSLGTSFTLRPQAIPLDVKIILLGSRELYYVMQEHDEEFAEHFRVLADFEYVLSPSEKVTYQFISKAQSYAEQTAGMPLTECAMMALMRFSYRQAEHQKKLSARFADVLDLINEAQFYAKQDKVLEITAAHVQEALAGKQYRTGQISESLLSDIEEGHTLIATEGQAIGRVNGLTVLHIGDTSFGSPARITATVYAGSDGVLDIEREADLGQAIHTKGVMLLTGYLGHKYAQEFALTLSANIAIEQSYGHIDGDSASLAELCALISGITQLPVRQGLAVTGSINQHGEVQAVGGVNEKIEGFFKLCKSRGLTGHQGAIVPKSNMINLVLNDEVLDAVKRGQFHIYAVATVDEALTLLMNQAAGTLGPDGYAENTINYVALKRLQHIADIINGDDEETEKAP